MFDVRHYPKKIHKKQLAPMAQVHRSLFLDLEAQALSAAFNYYRLNVIISEGQNQEVSALS